MLITSFLQKVPVETQRELNVKIESHRLMEHEAAKARKKEQETQKLLNAQTQYQLTHKRAGRPRHDSTIIHQQTVNIYGNNNTNSNSQNHNNYDHNKLNDTSKNSESDYHMEIMDTEGLQLPAQNEPSRAIETNSNYNNSYSKISASAPSDSESISVAVTVAERGRRPPGQNNRPQGYGDWIGNYQLFAMIVAAVQAERGWAAALSRLRAPAYCRQFDKLNESTLRGWFEPGTYKLYADVKEKWKIGNSNLFRANNSRPYFLKEHAGLETSIKAALNNMRKTGCVVNSIAVAALFKSMLRVKAPDLLQSVSLSRRYCRYWVRRHLGWTYKKATTSGQKLPQDWEDQMKLMLHRAAAAVRTHKIKHPSLVINWDQTGVNLMPTFHYTYHDKKTKQVPVVALDEKRQITAVVASALSGDMLPLQLIFGGQDTDKKQQKSVPKLNEELAQEVLKKHSFHLTQTHNHWSTLDSMQDYVRKIIVPFVNNMKQQHSCLDSDTLLLFDCWSVHKSHDFLKWLRETYPTFHVVFIPAGCTSKAQPADVLLQRPFKNEISNNYTLWMMQQTEGLLRSGADPATIRISTGITMLKPLAVEWSVNSWKLLQKKRETIADGWKNLGFSKIFDLDFQVESLVLVAGNKIQIEPEQDANVIEPEPISWAETRSERKRGKSISK